MKEMIAVCGLDCHECVAFLATQENNDLKRAEVSQEWSKLFKVEVKPEDINCDGCQSDGGVFSIIAKSAKLGSAEKKEV